MRNISKFAVISAMIFAVAMLIIPAAAQEGLGPGEGGTIFVHATEDPTYLSPLLSQEAGSNDIIGRFTPGLFGLDPFTASLDPDAKGALATGWEFDETGLILTVHMREDAYWSDGEQITADDLMYAVTAMKSGLLNSPYPAQYFTALDNGTQGTGQISEVIKVDDFTVQIVFGASDCNNLINASWLTGSVVPSHIYEADFGDDYAAINADNRYLPGVYFGAWMDPVLEPGVSVSMIPNQDFPDTVLGYVSPGEWTQLILPDDDIALERFRAGELTMYQDIPNWEVENFADTDFQMYEYTSRTWTYIGFNLANPDNPQSAYDEAGNYIPVDPHPILGDVLVRQAMAHAVDIDTVIETYKGGLSINLGAPTIPGYPDYDPELVITFDPDLSMQLLDEAGWVMEDGKEFRVCRGCAYAAIDPNYEGTELALEWLVYSGLGETFENYMHFMGEQWRAVGINVEPSFVDYGTVMQPATDGQTFDMFYGGWRLGLPADPDKIDLFGIAADIPNAGFNTGSYHNPELDKLFMDARNPELTDNCNMDVRAELYKAANVILHDDMPYIYLWTNKGYTVAQPNLENWNPAPQFRMWDEDAWVIAE